MAKNFLPRVKAQYESHPYPERDPMEEKKRLVVTGLDWIPRLNHYCFSGSFWRIQKPRLLVAGGGTGDAVIFLAEQLKRIPHEITYVDLSAASMRIARKRAEVRGLNGIKWIRASLLDLDINEVGVFDYINCSGVIHHLQDPVAGLNKIRSLLAPGGCLGVMVYAKYGRTAIYQMQELIRRVCDVEQDPQRAIDTTRKIIEELPSTNWFKRSENLISDHVTDAGAYDLFLHSQDRAFSVPELKALLDECDLKFIEFSSNKNKYIPRTVFSDETILRSLDVLDIWDQRAIAELACGDIIKHSFYCGIKADVTATLDDKSKLFFISQKILTDIRKHMIPPNYGGTYTLNGPAIAELKIPVTPKISFFFELLNGPKTFGEIIDAGDKDSSNFPESSDSRQVYTGLAQSLIERDFVYLSV
jgi:SAM-dependent methyltransferase